MLYLDSSALVKRYVPEPGSKVVVQRFRAGERIFTSALSYAEVLTTFGRKYQNGELKRQDFETVRNDFLHHWIFLLNVIEVDTNALSALKGLVERYPLKAADAVHLSSAIWLRDTVKLLPEFSAGDTKIEFWVADKALAKVAAQCGLAVFNPEAAS